MLLPSAPETETGDRLWNHFVTIGTKTSVLCVFFFPRGLPTINFVGIKDFIASHAMSKGLSWTHLTSQNHSLVGYNLLCCQARLLPEAEPITPRLTEHWTVWLQTDFNIPLLLLQATRNHTHLSGINTVAASAAPEVQLTSPQGTPLYSWPLEISVSSHKGSQNVLQIFHYVQASQDTTSQGVD